MKKLPLLFFFLLSQLCFAQNLVPNPSFEDTIACPGPIQPTINDAANWSSFYGTSDYYNICASTSQPNWGVPHNFPGYQNAYDGNAYGGLVTWYVNAGSPIREYMGVQLTQILAVGTKYFVSCYISNGDSLICNSSSNKFGLKFSTVQYPNAIPSLAALMNNFSHIHTDSVITDKINWTRIAGSFIADSAYQYLVLGNFYDDFNTVVDTGTPAGNTGAYYYIDDIKVSTDSNYVNGVIEDIPFNSIQIFPNPTSNWLEIKGNEITAITLYDAMGREVYSNTGFISPLRINVSSFARGIYVVKAANKNSAEVRKIVLGP